MPPTHTSSIRQGDILNDIVLEVKNLKAHFFLEEGVLKAVDGVSFSVGRNETLGIIGESGCGKSVTAQSILRIIPDPGEIVAGRILLYKNGQAIDLCSLSPKGAEVRAIRGKEISMIFQEPMTSLSPVHTIGSQIVEAIVLHKTRDKVEAKAIALDMLERVGISNPALRFDEYPHHLSGGLRQRAMIAMALSCGPALLIADEPTTALDVTVQAQILDLMQHLQEQFGMSILYITHNLGVIVEIANHVAVMYLGRIVEYGTARDIFKHALHPYTVKLLRSVPTMGRKSDAPLDTIQGTVPIPLNFPQQCGFYSRCDRAKEGICNQHIPALVNVEETHFVRCFLFSETKESDNEE